MYFLSLLMVRKKAQRIEMGITSNIKQLQASIPEGVTLVAVSKFHPVEALQEAYDAGQRIFGENKAQELYSKQEVLPKDIQWHFIGHLHTNKIKFIVPFVKLIHGVDSLKVLNEINKQAEKADKITACLLSEDEIILPLDSLRMIPSQLKIHLHLTIFRHFFVPSISFP